MATGISFQGFRYIVQNKAVNAEVKSKKEKMRNKANLPSVQMSVTAYATKEYTNIDPPWLRKNKANSQSHPSFGQAARH